MDTIDLVSIDSFHKIFSVYRSHGGLGYLFRGQADASWSLLPKAGRLEYFLSKNGDLKRFKDWEHQAIAYGHNQENFLESLAIAQHHGLATRLLDWSRNPLVAAYFAACSEESVDGAIYVLEHLDMYFKKDFKFEFMEELEGVYCYFPRPISPRMLNQSGIFTIHCPSTHEIEVKKSNGRNNKSNLIKITIPSNLKAVILDMLNDYGINKSILFPDLDGLSHHKNSETEKLAKKQIS